MNVYCFGLAHTASVREILECWFSGRPIRDECLIVHGGNLGGVGAHSLGTPMLPLVARRKPFGSKMIGRNSRTQKSGCGKLGMECRGNGRIAANRSRQQPEGTRSFLWAVYLTRTSDRRVRRSPAAGADRGIRKLRRINPGSKPESRLRHTYNALILRVLTRR